eukprot:CAMPEP_0114596426 /NCGR_PEP_ID=MMETSP0125-20121206/18419_1 /TAXON_ID=485358 ORGANISM="Aristerostoma sp., Strain ATCC 50986" /NCGR_SAMPLE_ID=MMETSP0125 /ASSEMBLY_ACC=CAM_ASM_000245 /LENGTH=125 /DNA_ID=CAMNT_0001799391 /DNA_START=1005 /DNA_END=1382 /DNA_ORIENTATION=-
MKDTDEVALKLYKLAQAYENTGDSKQAQTTYDRVLLYIQTHLNTKLCSQVKDLIYDLIITHGCVINQEVQKDLLEQSHHAMKEHPTITTSYLIKGAIMSSQNKDAKALKVYKSVPEDISKQCPVL